jgi:import inner membrane translocase subunit TIM50
LQDLSYLNRDLSKVILLDTHPEHVSSHPENAIIMPKWTGAPGDKGLIAMIPFLECTSMLSSRLDLISFSLPRTAIGIYKTPDVRPILQAYAGKDIPIEYAEKEAEAKRKHIEEWKTKARGLSKGGFTLSGMFGGASEVSSSVSFP